MTRILPLADSYYLIDNSEYDDDEKDYYLCDEINERVIKGLLLSYYYEEWRRNKRPNIKGGFPIRRMYQDIENASSKCEKTAFLKYKLNTELSSLNIAIN